MAMSHCSVFLKIRVDKSTITNTERAFFAAHIFLCRNKSYCSVH